MRKIRYEDMVVDSSNRSILRLSNYKNCHEVEICKLGEQMISLSNRWEIDSENIVLDSVSLLELLKYLKEHSESIEIYLKTQVDYWILKGISITDEILDFCDGLIIGY